MVAIPLAYTPKGWLGMLYRQCWLGVSISVG